MSVEPENTETDDWEVRRPCALSFAIAAVVSYVLFVVGLPVLPWFGAAGVVGFLPGQDLSAAVMMMMFGTAFLAFIGFPFMFTTVFIFSWIVFEERELPDKGPDSLEAQR
tara:strand:+ start:261 stop:590 length:330 start_codon:yes stop_codon:yes gene_type:complete